MDVARDRDALYYPYIHVRDANWLKAALLSFPQVRRIVPKGFTLKDSEAVRPFADTEGVRGPLLAEEPASMLSAYRAQERLLKRLKAAPPKRLARYSLKNTTIEFPDNPHVFEMHVGKLQPLLSFLESRKMVWPSREQRRGEWYALHPKLGEVIMSIIAIALATESQLDIVTNSGHVHRTLAHLDENALLADFLEETSPGPGEAGPSAGMVDELCQVVMLTTFDLSKFTAKDIASLQKDGMDLRRFKNGILKIAQTIPDIPDTKQREKRLKDAAEEVRVEWDKYRKSLPHFALDTMMSTSNWKAPEVLTGMMAGASSTAVLTLGSGLLIGAAVYAGVAFWRGYKEQASSPYQFLSQIQKAGATLAPRPVHVRSAH